MRGQFGFIEVDVKLCWLKPSPVDHAEFYIDDLPTIPHSSRPAPQYSTSTCSPHLTMCWRMVPSRFIAIYWRELPGEAAGG